MNASPERGWLGMNLNEVMDELAKLARFSLLALIPLTLSFVIIGYFSNSLTIMSLSIDEGFSIIVHLFAYQAVRAMKSADPIRFPHGTGKLENFSGFLYGALTIPIGCYIIFRAGQHLIAPESDVSYSLAQVSLIPSLLVNLYIYRWATRLSKQIESPLVESYVIDYRVAVWFDTLVILAMAIGYLMVRAGAGEHAVYIDPAFSLAIGLYMLSLAAEQLLKNFRVLIDLPMPEKEQLEVIRVLASEFDAYEQLGSIRTRRSGSQRMVEIEMYFSGNVDVKAIAALTARLQNKLCERLADVKLNILVMELYPSA